MSLRRVEVRTSLLTNIVARTLLLEVRLSSFDVRVASLRVSVNVGCAITFFVDFHLSHFFLKV